jgi:hypothetical protein
MLIAFSCSGPDSDQPLLTAELPLHLEEHIDDARIVGSEVPEDLPAPIEWRFGKPHLPLQSGYRKGDALRYVPADRGGQGREFFAI